MLVTIHTYQSLVEAKLAQGRLESHGITSFVADEHMGSFYPLGVGGFRLQVAEIDLEMAQEILTV